MKKIFLILCLLSVVFTSCDNGTPKDQTIVITSVLKRCTIEKINYEGHEYLIYREGLNQGTGRIGGVTHSGNCPCFKNDSIR